MSDDPGDMRAVFLDEMAELVQDIEKDLLYLETAPGSRGVVDRLFRNLHTIKGGAGMAGMDALAHYTHAVENMLDEVRRGSLVMSSGLVSLLLEALDCLKGFMAESLGAGTLDQDAVAVSHHHILRAMGRGAAAPADPASGLPAPAGHLVPAPVLPVAPPPAAADTAAAETATPPLLNTLLIQVRVGPEPLPSAAACDQVTAALETLGELLTVSHDHSLPSEEKRPAETGSLWRSFHLVTDAADGAVRDALGDWTDRYRVDIHRLSLVPEAPENQAQIDAAVDGGLGDLSGLAVGPGAAPATAAPIAVPVAVEPPPPRSLSQPKEAGGDGRGDSHASKRLASVRVDIGKLDKLVTAVGELITVKARLDRFQTAMEARDPDLADSLLTILDDSSRTLRELQDQAMTIRMVPIGGAFDPMQRLVRDTCRDLGKEVRLTISGRDTEVDKKVSEQISGPLKHLIRNALDHGIETPADRVARGKPPEGEIRLAAYHEYGLIVIEVADDGRGIDVERVVRSARQKGLVDPAKDLTEREALDLIFAPAVSTAETITEVSGRGVGMDVVKRDIEALRGTVDVATTVGKGTILTVRIPLTLSIIDGLLVRIGVHLYVIPLSAVEECVQLDPGAGIAGSSNSFLELRDRLIPFLRLREVFAVAGPPPPFEKVVIVSTGERRVGLVVDHLLGDHQTVVKPLSRLLKDVHCFSGATILGDGRVVLILDVLHLIDFGQSREERLRT